MARPLLLFSSSAALLASASALSSIPAVGVPCASVSSSNPLYAKCDPNYVATPNYYAQMKAGTLSLAQLAVDTSGSCDFMEDQFEETFNSPTLNSTRWTASELDGQEHCIGRECPMRMRSAHRWR